MIRHTYKIKDFKEFGRVNDTLKTVSAFATRPFPQNQVQVPLAAGMVAVNELARSAFIG
jgi:hypothetical protein